jgi:peptidyl-prolyl cis-trans isomerase SurA
MSSIAGRHLTGAAMIILALGMTVPPQAAFAQSAIKVVVDGSAITTNEINERARFLRLVHKSMGPADLTKAAMEELVEDRLKLKEAARLKMVAADAEVDEAFGRMAAGMKATPAILVQALQAQGINAKTLKARIKAQITWQRMVVQRFSRTISISDSAIVDALAKKSADGKADTPDKNAVAQGTTTEYSLQQITFVVPKQPAGMGAQRMKEAEAMRAKVTNCDQLVDAAKAYREVAVKSIGKRTADELPPQFKDLLAGVAVGKLTKPSPGANAVEMLAVCGTREIQGNFAVRKDVENQLKEEEGALMARRYLAELKRQAIIDYK